MTKKSAKKYGFFMCLCMTIGTIIGTGIFFKNEGVYGYTNGNGILGIIAWSIGGITAIAFGLSFMEISSSKQDSNSGIALYARIFGGSKFGKVVRNAMNHIYIPITVFTVAYYTTKASLWAIGGGTEIEDNLANKLGEQNYMILLIVFAMIYAIFICYLAIFQEKVGKWIQIITVILKLIPLIIIGLVGLFIVNEDAGAFKISNLGDPKNYPKVSQSQFSMILMALPGILFAFDGFLSTTYIQKDVRNAKKNIPLALILGLTGVTFIYILTSIGILNLDPSGDVAKAVVRIFNNKIVNQIFIRVIFIFIAISAFGTLNGYCFAFTKMNNCGLEDQFLLGQTLWKRLTEKAGIKLTNLVSTILLTFIWMLIMTIPTISTSGEYDFIEFLSNSAVVMAFLMYGGIIFMGILNRFQKRTKTNNYWYFIPSAILALTLISLIIGYNIYSYFEFSISSVNKTGPILQIVLLLLILALPWTGWFMREKIKNDEEIEITIF